MSLHFGKIPTELDPEQIHDYLFYLQKKSKSPSQSYFKHTVYGIRFLLKSEGLSYDFLSLNSGFKKIHRSGKTGRFSLWRTRFDYKDYRQKGIRKQMVLSHEEFIRRFAMHILRKRFVKIRHYGFLSSTWKRGKLQGLQESLKVERSVLFPRLCSENAAVAKKENW